MSEENLNDPLDQIKGTTAVAFFHEHTIKVVVDSRESSEGVTDRGPNWKIRVLNTAEKWYEISANILAIMVGTKSANFNMRARVMDWARDMEKDGKEINVSAVSLFVENYLKDLDTQIKAYNFGTIIAGHDTTKGLQIYRIFIVGTEVKNQQVHMFASFGTGSIYSNHHMVHRYNFNSTEDDAKQFAYKTLFNSSFHDKNTDGNIHFFEVTKDQWSEKESIQALQAYSNYYEQYDERCILFLLYADTKEIIPTDDLIIHFRPHGDIIVAHYVDHRRTSAKGFYFHRLVFVSKEEADKAFTYVKNHPSPDKCKNPTIVSQFPYQLNLNNYKLFVQKASKQLLDYIISNSAMVLDGNPT